MAIEAYPLQLVPVAQVAVYETEVIGLTDSVLPVPKVTAVLEVNDQVIVPVQFMAVKVIGVLAQTLFTEAIMVGVIPSPPTLITF
jgi:hypothetical protein